MAETLHENDRGVSLKSKKKRGADKAHGEYIFGLDYLKSVADCDYDAKGLWADIFMNMIVSDSIRGVAPGDPVGLAGFLGMPSIVAEPWHLAIQKPLQQLEDMNVFSRGRDVDDRLPVDAIVNRRLFEKWKADEAISEARRQAAYARWGTGHSEYKSDAKLSKPPTNGNTNNNANEVHSDNSEDEWLHGVVKKLGGVGDAKSNTNGVQSGCLPNRTEPNLPQPNLSEHSHRYTNAETERSTEHGEPTAVGACVGSVLDSDFGVLITEPLMKRILRVTSDNTVWMIWWSVGVERIEPVDGGISMIVGWLDYIEGCATEEQRSAKQQGVIDTPGRFLVKRVLEWTRQNSVKMPPLPEGGAKGCVKK